MLTKGFKDQTRIIMQELIEILVLGNTWPFLAWRRNEEIHLSIHTHTHTKREVRTPVLYTGRNLHEGEFYLQCITNATVLHVPEATKALYLFL